jgi:Delta3-Delta2-enoyl-CoA isomerase
MPSVDHRDGVSVLDLGDDENMIDAGFLGAVHEALDEVEALSSPRALVSTASGRFFTTGLDVGAIAREPEATDSLVQSMHRLFARMLALPVPTVAALNGHTFAGGALFALTHDRRVMRADRGFFCLPEIDGQIALTPGLGDLLVSRLGPALALRTATSGQRYTGEEARACGIVEETAPPEDLLPLALSIAGTLADKDPATLGTMKARLQRATIASLLDAEANAVDPAEFATMIAIVEASA